MGEQVGSGAQAVLPSKGLPYEGAIPDGEVMVYPMTTADEKMFAGIASGLDFENVIDAMIKRRTNISEKLRAGELYAGDRTYLMMMIRAVSYGQLYGIKITCPKCAARWDHNLDLLKDLEVREVPEDHEDPFKVELPVSGDTLSLRLFRGDDERAVIKFVEQQNKKVNIKQIGDHGYTYRLALHVQGVTVNQNPENSFDSDSCKIPGVLMARALDYVERLTALDSSAIRDELDARTPGIILGIEAECPKCKNLFDQGLPISAEFFRSKPAGGVRTGTRVVSRTVR